MSAESWARWPDEVADQVRRDLFAATALDDREGLERFGLLVSPVLPTGPAAPVTDDPHLDAIREGILALADTDKSRFRPGEPDARERTTPAPQ